MNQTNALYANNLTLYFREVDKIDILTREEEYALAIRLHENGDVDAAQKLVLSHLRYVISIARGFIGYKLPLNDLIQEGNVGLMRAVKKFDPTKKVRLSSYAINYIKSEIYNFAIKNSRMLNVATTKPQRKLFFKLRSYKQDTSKGFTEEEIKNISEELCVKPEVVRTMESRMYNHDISLDCGVVTAEEKDFEALTAPISWLESDELNPEEKMEKEQLHKIRYKFLNESMSNLNENHRNVLQRRWLDEESPTLQEMADEKGVSPEAIRQQEERAINNMSRMATLL